MRWRRAYPFAAMPHSALADELRIVGVCSILRVDRVAKIFFGIRIVHRVLVELVVNGTI